MTTVLAFVVVLGVLVFVHELGHFAAAKWAGIYVHRFSIGMGAPIPWLRVRRGETEYAISWLPLGGYVRMASREEEGSARAIEGGDALPAIADDRYFEAKPVWKRIIVISAGVVMNIVFAWGVFLFLAVRGGRQVDPTVTVGRVAATLPAGAEALATLAPGDRIASVNGRPVTSWDDIEAGIADATGDSLVLALGDGRRLAIRIHGDAVAERLRASQSISPYRAPVVGTVMPGRPAARAGLEMGDSVISIDGAPVAQWYDFVRVVEGAAGRELLLVVSRAGARREVRVTPGAESITDSGGAVRTVGKIGVGIQSPTHAVPYSGLEPLGAATRATLGATGQIWRTVKGLVAGRVSRSELGGPILIGQLAGQTARLGLEAFLGFMALISVNLAVLNILPIPLLDGGHLVFLVAEGILRRPLSLQLRERLSMVGLGALGLVFLLALSNDIRRLIGL